MNITQDTGNNYSQENNKDQFRLVRDLVALYEKLHLHTLIMFV